MTDELLSCQRALFDVPEDVCYLNCAYMSPLLQAVRGAGEEGVALKARPWTLTREHWFGRVEEVRGRFARLIGASPDDVALVPSVSYGIGTAAANCPLESGQTVVLLEDQFPSCIYPWRRRARETGAKLVTVPRPENGDWTPAILAAVDYRCAAVNVPACHWTDGAAIDLERVSAAARSVGAQLVLDVSQSLGAAPLDVGEVDPDWLCAPAYKWLLGPYSFGFLYVAARNQDGTPLEEGWLARVGSENFSSLVEYTDDYRSGAIRYDVGERSNFVLLPMASAALEQILGWGVERIAATLRGTTDRLAAIATRYGFRTLPAELRSPHILGLERDGGLPRDLVARLAEGHVHVGRRANTIRVSPHLHVNDRDLDQFEIALARLDRQGSA